MVGRNTSFRNPPVFMKSSTQHSTEAAVFIGAASSVEVLACRNSSMRVPRNRQITLVNCQNVCCKHRTHIAVGAKRFHCAVDARLYADTARITLPHSVGSGARALSSPNAAVLCSGARVLVARSIFTVGAKRCRCTEVLIKTEISIRLRILTAPKRNHHHSSRQTLLLVPNTSVTRKYRSSRVTVQHEVCLLHPQRAVQYVVLSRGTTVFQRINQRTAKEQTALSVVMLCLTHFLLHVCCRLDHDQQDLGGISRYCS